MVIYVFSAEQNRILGRKHPLSRLASEQDENCIPDGAANVTSKIDATD
jgi:hypothetical protein